MPWLRIMVVVVRGLLLDRADLATENPALRQQLAVVVEQKTRSGLRTRDRIFWVWLSRLWANCRSPLVIVRPHTVVRRYAQSLELYRRWRPRGTPGRPGIAPGIRNLTRRMCREDPTWGRPPIRSEFTLHGYVVSETTVHQYMIRHRRPPSETWRTLLDNHLRGIVAIDFFTVPTATFRIPFAFVVLRHDRRIVVHFNATALPPVAWTAPQIAEAFPFDESTRFLIRDREWIYGAFFRERVENLSIEQVVIALRSPWRKDHVACCTSLVRSGETSGNLLRSDSFCPWLLTGPLPLTGS